MAHEQQDVAALLEAIQTLRNGYADAIGGLRYIAQEYGRLGGVGWDRVEDHFFKWVEMAEREGFLAGSHQIGRASIMAKANPEAPE